MKKAIRALFFRLPRSWILFIAGVFSRLVEVKSVAELKEEEIKEFRILSGPARRIVFCLPAAQRWQAASFSLGLNEIDVSQALYGCCRPDSVVLELGASVGYHTLRFSRLAKEVYAFEPNPAAFALLRQSVDSNGLSNVRLFPYAVSDRSGQEEFDTLGSTDGLAHLVSVQTARTNSKKCSVTTVSVDDFVTKQHIQRVDLIKIDIEGAELLAFDGMTQTLRTWRPSIVVELNGNERLQEGTDFLKSFGYTCHILNPGPSFNVLAICE